jgi:hypothetical protein
MIFYLGQSYMYFNPLVFWYQWEKLLTSKDFCSLSKMVNVVIIYIYNLYNHYYEIINGYNLI